jgi:hypothetical protein
MFQCVFDFVRRDWDQEPVGHHISVTFPFPYRDWDNHDLFPFSLCLHRYPLLLVSFCLHVLHLYLSSLLPLDLACVLVNHHRKNLS